MQEREHRFPDKFLIDTMDEIHLYNIVNIADNARNRVAVAIDFSFDSSGFGNILPTNPAQLLHTRIQIQTASEPVELIFKDYLMAG